MSFIYRFGAPLVAVLSCALSRNSRQVCAAAALGSAAVSAPFTLMRAWEKKKIKESREKKEKRKGKFCSQSAWMDVFRAAAARCPPVRHHIEGFPVASASSKLLQESSLARVGGRELCLHVACPHPHHAPEPQGWSRQGWEEALPHGAVQP